MYSQNTTSPSLIEKITVAMIGFFAFLQVYSVQAILPILQQDLSANEVQVGMAVGATVLAIACISPFMGMLSDAFGRRRFIIGSLFLLALPTAMLAFSEQVQSLIFWRFMQGLSIPGITVVLIAYVSEEYSKSLTTMMSLYVSGTVLGGFAGRFLAGYFEHFYGWRTGYILMAVCTIIGALWAWYSLPKSKNFVVSENFTAALSMLANHAKNRHVISCCVLGACVLFSLVGCFTFINLHLADAPYQLNTATLANIFAIYLIGMVITPLSARLMNGIGTIKTIIMAVCLSIVGILMTLLSPLLWIIVGLTLMSSGVFITQSATISHLTSQITQGRSLASGLYYLSYYGGGFVGAWGCAMAYRFGEWTATVGLIVCFQAMAIGIALFAMRSAKTA